MVAVRKDWLAMPVCRAGTGRERQPYRLLFPFALFCGKKTECFCVDLLGDAEQRP